MIATAVAMGQFWAPTTMMFCVADAPTRGHRHAAGTTGHRPSTTSLVPNKDRRRRPHGQS